MTIEPKDIYRLKELYKKAITQNKESFIFAKNGESQEVLTSYAKYLIIYLTTLKNHK